MRILQYLMEAMDLSVYSYIKPGAVHRYSLQDQDLHRYVKTVSVSLNSYLQAYSLGESLARGSSGIQSINLGRLVSQAISASFSKLSAKSVVELHLALIPTTTSISYTLSIDRGVNLNTFRRAFTLVLTHSDVKEVLEVYTALRKFDRYERLLTEMGISEGVIRTNSLNLRNLYVALGRKVVPLSTLTDRQDVIVGMSGKFVKTYEETYDYNLAAISSYIYGLEALYSISTKSDLLKGRDALNELYKLDKEFRSKGYDFNDLIPVLAASTLLSLHMLEYPARD